jgi:hypothetical protein
MTAQEARMFGKVMAAALAIGAAGGASIAVAQNVARPAEATHVNEAVVGATCAPVAFRIYFEEGSTRLDTEARHTIKSASREVVGCQQLDVQLAADDALIANPAMRRQAAERSVAVRNALRTEGVDGEMYVAPSAQHVVSPEANAGPDFVEVGLTPTDAPQRIAQND